jgi:hypothetical protein
MKASLTLATMLCGLAAVSVGCRTTNGGSGVKELTGKDGEFDQTAQLGRGFATWPCAPKLNIGKPRVETDFTLQDEYCEWRKTVVNGQAVCQFTSDLSGVGAFHLRQVNNNWGAAVQLAHDCREDARRLLAQNGGTNPGSLCGVGVGCEAGRGSDPQICDAVRQRVLRAGTQNFTVIDLNPQFVSADDPQSGTGGFEPLVNNRPEPLMKLFPVSPMPEGCSYDKLNGVDDVRHVTCVVDEDTECKTLSESIEVGIGFITTAKGVPTPDEAQKALPKAPADLQPRKTRKMSQQQ